MDKSITGTPQKNSRCTGHCCQAFVLGMPFEEMKARAGFVEDGIQIATMLMPLGVFAQNPHNHHILEEPREHFTCKNLSSSGDCLIYEDRPAMCRNYPYDKDCTFQGCTMDGPCKKRGINKK